MVSVSVLNVYIPAGKEGTLSSEVAVVSKRLNTRWPTELNKETAPVIFLEKLMTIPDLTGLG